MQHAQSYSPLTVQLWHCADATVKDVALLREIEGWLSREEQARHQRFLFAKDRHQFLVSRGLLRAVLSAELGCEPQDLRFNRNEWGKPVLAMPSCPDADTLHFNLSHTRGRIVLATYRGNSENSVTLGVDLEWLGRSADTVRLASRYFSPAECRDLEALDEAARRERFFVLWTLKEAYIKAVGMGLAIPLADFSFSFSGTDIHIAFSNSRREDEPAHWAFRQCWMSSGEDGDPGYCLALALNALGSGGFFGGDCRSTALPVSWRAWPEPTGGSSHLSSVSGVEKSG